MNVKLYKIDQIYYADYMLLLDKLYQKINYGTLNMDILVHYRFVVSLKKMDITFINIFSNCSTNWTLALFAQTPDVRFNVKTFIG